MVMADSHLIRVTRGISWGGVGCRLLASPLDPRPRPRPRGPSPARQVLGALEFQIQRAERELRLQLEDPSRAVVGEPDLGAPALGEEALRLDDRLNDDRVELAERDFNGLPSQDLDDDWIAVRVVVAIELVRPPDLELHRPHEVNE